MIEVLRQIVEKALQRLLYTIDAYLPPLLACIVIFLGAWLVAVLLRLLLTRIFKGAGVDSFLRQSGLANLLGIAERPGATRLVAGLVYWTVLGIGLLTGLNAFDTSLTTRIVEAVVFLMPKLVSGGLILLVGIWLAHFLGRSMLVWAVNEDLPHPRKLAAATRLIIGFVAVVVTADHLSFARHVFLAAFVILVGGLVLAASLALGLGGKEFIRQQFSSQPKRDEEPAKSLWNHL